MTATTPRRAVVLASSNPGKLREIRELLTDLDIDLRPLSDFPDVELPEEGDDYEANALAKARDVVLRRPLREVVPRRPDLLLERYGHSERYAARKRQISKKEIRDLRRLPNAPSRAPPPWSR